MNIIKIPLNPPLLKGEVKTAIFASIPFYTLKGTVGSYMTGMIRKNNQLTFF
jgi:hypothetical protein